VGFSDTNRGDEAKALDFTTKVFKNAPVLLRDARESSDVFSSKVRRCLNQLRKRGGWAEWRETAYVIPDVNISIDNPVAVVDKTLINTVPEVAEAFVDFLFTPVAQREFTKVGFDPLTPRWQKK